MEKNNTNIAIVDDDATVRETLYQYILQMEKEENVYFSVHFFTNGTDFLKEYAPVFDVVLMDIEMPGLDGLSAAKKMREQDTETVLIFVTNMAQYALKGYEVDAIDYILKPVGYYEFYIKMKKAMRFISKTKSKKLVLDVAGGVVQVMSSDVYFIEVFKHYVTYHTKRGQFTTRGSLKELEVTLKNYHFARVNLSHIVNMKYVTSFKGYLILVNDVELTIGRKWKDSLMRKFAHYVLVGGGGKKWKFFGTSSTKIGLLLVC